MVEYNPGGIPYSLYLPINSPGSYLVSAVINNGWCKSHTQGAWIKSGDLYNDKIHDFEIKSSAEPIGKNIQTSVYIEDPSANNNNNNNLNTTVTPAAITTSSPTTTANPYISTVVIPSTTGASATSAAPASTIGPATTVNRNQNTGM